MAEDIVTGLFGLTPQAVEEQRRAAAVQDIMNFQNLDLGQQSAYLAGQAGYGLGRKIGGMLGMVDPLVEQAQMRQAILSNLDPNDPESYLKVAKAAQNAGDIQTAMKLKIAANDMVEKQRKAVLDDARIARELAIAKKLATPPTEPEGKYGSDIKDLLTEQAKYPVGSREWNIYEAKLKSIGHDKTAGSIGKPKGLSREASLKFDLDNGYIDQETYDLAMRGTPGGRASEKANIKKADEQKSFDYLNRQFIAIENTMADSLGIPLEQLNSALTVGKGSSAAKLERAVGVWDSLTPKWMQSQTKANILSHIERLKSLGETSGMAELRKAGIAPGSITEKEWPKFRASLGNIDTSLEGKELVKQYLRIFQDIQDTRTKGQEYISGMTDDNSISIDERLKKYLK